MLAECRRRLALVPLASIMSSKSSFISNPCLLVRLKPDANQEVTTAALENFVTKEAKVALDGSHLLVKSINGFVR